VGKPPRAGPRRPAPATPSFSLFILRGTCYPSPDGAPGPPLPRRGGTDTRPRRFQLRGVAVAGGVRGRYFAGRCHPGRAGADGLGVDEVIAAISDDGWGCR